MAITNPTSGRASGILRQIVAERQESQKQLSPSAQPGAPIRGIVQNPALQAESPGSARVASVRPELTNVAQPAVAPAGSGMEGAAATVPGTPVAPAEVPAPAPAPAAPPPGAGQQSTPEATPMSAPAAIPAPNAPPQGPVGRPTGSVLGASTSSPVRRSRLINRLIVGLPTSITA